MKSRIGDYSLLETLGSGSNGVVYRASCPERLGIDAEHVVLKVFNKHHTNEDLKEFLHAIRLFSSARSPHLVKLLDGGSQNRSLFLAMEYLPRGHLGDSVATTAVTVRAISEAARGAHSLHEVGLAHRNIKPSNVLMSSDGARLAEPGVAHILSPGSLLTNTDSVSAIECLPTTVLYGDEASRTSDIWGLAATLHKALTGKSVYGMIPKESVRAAIQFLLDRQPAVDDSIGANLRPVLKRALASEPEERYATAAEFADALEEQA